MLGSVVTVPRSLEDYRATVGGEVVEGLRQKAQPLRGARVIHINATAFGGGVAEVLGALVPLMNDVGLRAEWQAMQGNDEFFRVSKALHNSLQGMFIPWTHQMWQTWLHYNQLNANLFDQDYDFVMIHDPQPAAILQRLRLRGGVGGKWLWRCHIDLTEAQPEVWDFLHPFIELYDGAIFTMPEYIKQDLRRVRTLAIAPAIDPLGPKNADLPPEMVRDIILRHGVDPGRPFILQVSRFDPWKDPLGVIDVYRMVKRRFPKLQLVMIAAMAHDDPEGWFYYERTARRAGEDYDIHLLSNLNGVGNVEVNAFQRAAAVVVQKSLREGFGLVVAEALWKARPVVASNVGGIPLQIISGQTGYLTNSTAECADRVSEILEHTEEARLMGEAGREHIRQNFLITRYLGDYLRLFNLLGVEGGRG